MAARRAPRARRPARCRVAARQQRGVARHDDDGALELRRAPSSATRTAWPVPSCSLLHHGGGGRVDLGEVRRVTCSRRVADDDQQVLAGRAPGRPRRRGRACERPASACSTLGVALRIRVPSPAASTTTAAGRAWRSRGSSAPERMSGDRQVPWTRTRIAWRQRPSRLPIAPRPTRSARRVRTASGHPPAGALPATRHRTMPSSHWYSVRLWRTRTCQAAPVVLTARCRGPVAGRVPLERGRQERSAVHPDALRPRPLVPRPSALVQDTGTAARLRRARSRTARAGRRTTPGSVSAQTRLSSRRSHALLRAAARASRSRRQRGPEVACRRRLTQPLATSHAPAADALLALPQHAVPPRPRHDPGRARPRRCGRGTGRSSRSEQVLLELASAAEISSDVRPCTSQLARLRDQRPAAARRPAAQPVPGHGRLPPPCAARTVAGATDPRGAGCPRVRPGRAPRRTRTYLRLRRGYGRVTRSPRPPRTSMTAPPGVDAPDTTMVPEDVARRCRRSPSAGCGPAPSRSRSGPSSSCRRCASLAGAFVLWGHGLSWRDVVLRTSSTRSPGTASPSAFTATSRTAPSRPTAASIALADRRQPWPSRVRSPAGSPTTAATTRSPTRTATRTPPGATATASARWQGPLARPHRLALRPRADRPGALRARPARRPRHPRVDKHFPLWVAFTAAARRCSAACRLAVVRGGLEAFFWASLVRVGLLHHVTWSINSICHIFGESPFADPRQSRQRVAARDPVDGRVAGTTCTTPTRPPPGTGSTAASSTPAPSSSGFEKLGWATDVRWPTPRAPRRPPRSPAARRLTRPPEAAVRRRADDRHRSAAPSCSMSAARCSPSAATTPPRSRRSRRAPGCSKPVVYEHFGGKEGLYAVVVDREIDTCSPLHRALSGDTPRVRSSRRRSRCSTYVEEHTDGFRILVRDSPLASATGGFACLSTTSPRRSSTCWPEFAARGFDPAAPLYAQALVGMVASSASGGSTPRARRERSPRTWSTWPGRGWATCRPRPRPGHAAAGGRRHDRRAGRLRSRPGGAPVEDGARGDAGPGPRGGGARPGQAGGAGCAPRGAARTAATWRACCERAPARGLHGSGGGSR